MSEPKTTGMDISEETVREFLQLRDSGKCNMLSAQVRDRLMISKDEHMYILGNLEPLCEQYGIDVDNPE